MKVMDDEDVARTETGRLVWLKNLWRVRISVDKREGGRCGQPW